MINENNFLQTTDTVIQHFEGGYYHPLMMKDGRVKYDARYNTSGETMFGIDRLNGTQLAKNPAWKLFWQMIDNANAKNLWKWNYRGGTLENPLRKLAGQMMFPWFMNLATKYLSQQAQTTVAADARLLIHFAYASWNGEGWFKRFATAFNTAVANGNTNPDQLTEMVVQARTGSSNSLIRQTGEKMKKLIDAISKKKT